MSSPQYPPSVAVKPLPSSPTVPSSNSPSSTQKADQIAHRIFVKLVNVVADARISPYSTFTSQSSSPHDTEGLGSPSRPSSPVRSPSGRSDRAQRKDPKNDKWFNLETPDFEQFKPELTAFKSLSALNKIPSLSVNVLLSIPATSTQTPGPHHGPNAAKVLVHRFTGTSNTRVTRVTPAPRYILLETHTLSLSGETMFSSGSVELPQVYKQAISLFRSVYTLLRILPSWKLQRRLRRSRGTASSSNLGIEIQLGIGKPLDGDDDTIAGFGAPHSQPGESLTSESIAFPPITTPLGSFAMRTVHRLHPHYTLEPLESLLSHHFLSPSPSASEYQRESTTHQNPRREAVQFTPTLTSALQRQRRESSTSSPRSPLPPVALPLPVPERARPLPIRSDLELASNRTGGDASPLGSLSGGAASNSSPRFGFLHGREPADLPFAVGLGSGRTSGVMERTRKESLLGSSGDRVSTPSLHGRRPSINSIHPFKSATISSSPSSTSFRTPTVPSDRPSLLLAPARYSSSFGNRPGSLAAEKGFGGGSGDTSFGAGDKSIGRPRSLSRGAQTRPLANEPLLNPADDDDILDFVKAIDTRAPLRGGLREETDHERDSAVEFPRYGKPSGPSLLARGASISMPSSPLRSPRGLDDGGDRGASRSSPPFEDDNASSRSGSPSGGRLAARTNMSSSSLFAGGRRSYDSGEQIVGRMDFADEEETRRRPGSRPADGTALRKDLDALQKVPFARPSRNY